MLSLFLFVHGFVQLAIEMEMMFHLLALRVLAIRSTPVSDAATVLPLDLLFTSFFNILKHFPVTLPIS